jgi:hypothetical protein
MVKKMYKTTNNDLQNIHKKTKDRVTRTPLKTGSSCSTSGTRRITLVTNPVISHEWGKDVLTYAWRRRTLAFNRNYIIQ